MCTLRDPLRVVPVKILGRWISSSIVPSIYLYSWGPKHIFTNDVMWSPTKFYWANVLSLKIIWIPPHPCQMPFAILCQHSPTTISMEQSERESYHLRALSMHTLGRALVASVPVSRPSLESFKPLSHQFKSLGPPLTSLSVVRLTPANLKMGSSRYSIYTIQG